MSLVSDCCGHHAVGNSDDYGICPDCREHFEYVEEDEEEDEIKEPPVIIAEYDHDLKTTIVKNED